MQALFTISFVPATVLDDVQRLCNPFFGWCRRRHRRNDCHVVSRIHFDATHFRRLSYKRQRSVGMLQPFDLSVDQSRRRNQEREQGEWHHPPLQES